jgi:predicted nucleic acid-binding Zn ribbon protein
MEKKCPVCKKAYTTFDSKKKYCSDQCAKKAGKK